MKKCERCRLNPNYTQSKQQQKWEREYIIEHGICSACVNELTENIVEENEQWIEKENKWVKK